MVSSEHLVNQKGYADINPLLRKWLHLVMSHLPCLQTLKVLCVCFHLGLFLLTLLPQLEELIAALTQVDVALGKHGAANGMSSGKG